MITFKQEVHVIEPSVVSGGLVSKGLKIVCNPDKWVFIFMFTNNSTKYVLLINIYYVVIVEA